jgi:hypothetical protein
LKSALQLGKSKKLSVFLSIILILAAVYWIGGWGWKFFLQDYYDNGINARGIAISEAANLAFGQKNIFPDHQVFANQMTPIDQKTCSRKNSDAPKYCLLVSPQGNGVEAYYMHCQWWRFENCTHINADSIFLTNPVMMQSLKQILLHPCQFLPTKTEIEIAKEKKKQEDALTGGLSVLDIVSFEQAFRDLSCAGPSQNLKIVMDFASPSNARAIILQTKIGE